MAAFAVHAFSIPLLCALKLALVEVVFKHTRGISHKAAKQLTGAILTLHACLHIIVILTLTLTLTSQTFHR